MARAILLVALLLTSHLLAGCDGKPAAGAAPSPPAVIVARPLQKKITEWDEYTGRFIAVATVEVRARVSGFIDSIHFKDGQIVKQGDLLFVIDPRPYKIAMEQAKADVERAQARLADRHRGRGTRAPLVRSQALTGREFDTRQIDTTRGGGRGGRSRSRVETGRTQSRMDRGARPHCGAHLR